jgi:hypothetical protein
MESAMPADEHLLRYFPNFDRHGTIWRYMEMAKFQSMIATSSLWMSRADKFDDTFEGSISEATRKAMPYGPDVTPGMIARFNVIHQWWKQWTHVSCWQYADHENALMWAAYAKKGVAIRTTFAKLAAQLPERAMISPVMYKDYSHELVPEGTHMRYFVKRHFFKSEREIRAVLINAPPNSEGTEDLGRDNPDLGLVVPVDLALLLDAVVARPYAPPDEIAILEAAISAAGLNIPVHASELSGEPLIN